MTTTGPEKNASEGNPINAANGNKCQGESDYYGSGAFPLNWNRFYNSFGAQPGLGGASFGSALNPFDPSNISGKTDAQMAAALTLITVGKFSNSPMDKGWRHSYDRTLVTQSSAVTIATLTRPDSRTRTFKLTGSAWVPDTGDVVTKLVQLKQADGTLIGWTYTDENDNIESYDALGKLSSIQTKGGLIQTLHYNEQNLLDSVTDPAGRTLNITYDPAGRVSVLTDPADGQFAYEYNIKGNLAKVTYPDSQFRQYVYENSAYSTLLTGIVDENNARFATWTYDIINGTPRARSSEHANGVEKVSLTYVAGSNSATDVSGATRTYTTQVTNGYSKVRAIVETCGANCSRTRSMSYDTHGNVTLETDFNNKRTTYVYDLSRDLETARTEASGTPQARTITTQWHPSFRFPTKITEPKRITTLTYFPNGKLQSKSEQASSDATGAAGMAAAAVGAARTWQYTYNAVGQLLTVTGPRTDVIDQTTYAYNANGDLASVTNAAGQTTLVSNYDPTGRVGRITDPNGLTTDVTYTPRGWVASRTTSNGGMSEQTSYEYDGAGQVKKVIMPDLSFISYTYDDAHRKRPAAPPSIAA